MQTRSTNSRFTHFGGDLVAHVESSHGVLLGGGSTGGIVEPIGDDANISLRLRPKAAGLLRLDSSQTQVGVDSTTPISAIQRAVVEFTIPEVAAGAAAEHSTITITGLTTNAAMFFTPRTDLETNYTIIPRCSTAGELKLLFQNGSGSTIGSAGSTSRGLLTFITF